MKYIKTKPVDKTDPGFRIPGKKIRWISSQVSENNPGRIWAVVRKSELPVDLVKHIESSNPDAFRGGDTIRRGDLVLGYASDEAVAELKADIKERAMEQEQIVSSGPGIKRQHGAYSKVEVNEESDATQEMLERFKAGKEN